MNVDEWTISIVENVVSQGVFETDRFDLKEMLPHSKDNSGKLRLKKTIAAFANTDGGFLVYGVKDDKGLALSERLVGIDRNVDFPTHFGSYPAALQPSVEWSFKNPGIKLASGKLIHIVHILPSLQQPHSVSSDSDAIYFLKRTNKGDETMSYYEVRSAFQQVEYRLTKLALLHSELDHIASSAKRVLETVPLSPPKGVSGTAHWAWATRYPTVALDMILGDAYSFIAEDLDIWRLLCEIRDEIHHSNACAEALAKIVFLATTNDEVIRRQQYGYIRSSATNITKDAAALVDKIKILLVGSSRSLKKHLHNE